MEDYRSQHAAAGSKSLVATFKEQLARAAGNARQIVRLADTAEKRLTEPAALCEVLEMASRAFGSKPHEIGEEEYGEVLLKRFAALCRLDLDQARKFHRFMGTQKIRQQDARTYQLRAELEVQAGDVAKAIVVLEDGLALGAMPSDTLVAQLQKCRGLAKQQTRNSGNFTTQMQRRPVQSGSYQAPARMRLGGGTGAFQPLSSIGNQVASAASSNTRARSAVEPPMPAPAFPLAFPDAGGNAAPETRESTGGGDTPLRPRTLRYSGASEDSSTGELQGAKGGRSSGASEISRQKYTMDDLSPIVEAGPEAPSSEKESPGDLELARQRLPPLSTGHFGVDCDSFESKEVDGRHRLVMNINGTEYECVQQIGCGASSKVYEVRSPSGELLALKTMATTCGVHFEAMQNEAALLTQLKDCEHVVNVIDSEVNTEQRTISIVMELGSTDLARLLHTETRLSLGDIQALWRQMLEAVQVIHAERIVHSDLKPANFLLVGQQLKLIDFGISKRIAGETTNISRDSPSGTLSYMAPEALKQGQLKLGRPSDVWSLGIILYLMVYRRTPFQHFDFQQRFRALSDPCVEVSFPADHCLAGHSQAVQADLLDTLRRCLNRDPQQRATIPELLEHPFARDHVRLDRSSFDRVMEALVAAFYSAVEAEIVPGPGAGRRTEPSGAGLQTEGLDPGNQCQALADSVWERLPRKRSRTPDSPQGGSTATASQLIAPPSDPIDVELLKLQLRHWLSHGAKRQRLEASNNIGAGSWAPAAHSTRTGYTSTTESAKSRTVPVRQISAPAFSHHAGKEVAGGHAVQRATAGAHAHATDRAAEASKVRGISGQPEAAALAPRPASARSAAPPAAAEAAAAAARPASARSAAAGHGASSATSSGKFALQPEMLQKQKVSLRKVGAASQGSLPHSARGPGPASQLKQRHEENVVLKRLKSQRAAPSEAAAEQDFMRWASSGA
mmetsp:Transcript_11901/g.27754  ORF Transcript_11901/g.27754 Transcript_11901/m.27754 type:complete len:960 (+) Transcript_11901:58-2937(+)